MSVFSFCHAVKSVLIGWYFQDLKSVWPGCISLVLKSEAAGSLIAPWWLATFFTVHKPRPLHVNKWEFSQKKKNYTSNTIFRNMFWSFKVVVIMLIYVQLFIFIISLILSSNLMLYKRGVPLWLIGSVGVWAEVWFRGSTSRQTLAPNKPLLHRLGLQMMSFTQDGNSHAEMYSLHSSIVEGSGDASSIFFTIYGLTWYKTLCLL